MFKFILKVFAFSLPLLILGGITEYQANFISNNYKTKRARLDEKVGAAQVIITGSSHAYNAVKPGLLGVPTVTIAYPGQDIYYDTRILLKYLPQAANTRLVIITISYHSLEYSMENSVWGSHISFYKKFWEIDHETPVFKLADYDAVALYGVGKSRDFLLTGKVKEEDEIDENGGVGNLRQTNYFEVENGQNAVKLQDKELNPKYIDQNMQYLDELIAALQVKYIQAVILTTPCSKSYYSNLNAERYLRMQNAVQILCRKHNLQYKNYLRDDRFSSKDFFDSNHLNTSGMEKFSYIVRDEIINNRLK
jgi:hypothetical protein